MNSDPASLDNLRDIVAPPPVSWWPPAPGWWIVFGVVLMAAMVVGRRAWKGWRSAAYRRAALRELESANNVAAVSEILKRAALCAFPRSQVASLSGATWCKWLGRATGEEMPSDVAEAMTRGVYAHEQPTDLADVKGYAMDWLEHHRSSDEMSDASEGK